VAPPAAGGSDEQTFEKRARNEARSDWLAVRPDREALDLLDDLHLKASAGCWKRGFRE